MHITSLECLNAEEDYIKSSQENLKTQKNLTDLLLIFNKIQLVTFLSTKICVL